MKMTVEVSNDLMRSIKIKAAQEGVKLKDLVGSLLERGLNAPVPEAGASSKGGLKTPLVRCKPDAPITRMSIKQANALTHQALEDEDVAHTGLSA
jgi:hypothetical protein